MSRLALVALLLAACDPPASPLAELDQRYTEIMVEVGVAERDTARNVRNTEARQRKSQAERAKVAFFRDPATTAVIDQSLTQPDGSLDRIKAEAYKRHLLVAGSWTEEEKDQENRLLQRLEEARGTLAEWKNLDGTVTAPLDDGWEDTSKSADALSYEERQSLATQYVDHRMRLVGKDLTALIELRNTVAKRAGYETYWHLALAGHQLKEDEVMALLAELEEVVAPVNGAMDERVKAAAAESGLERSFANEPLLRRKAGLELGRDDADAYFDTDLAESRIMTAFQDMGVPTDGWQVYTGPTRYVRPGVYGFPIRPPEFVAIVMSQSRRFSVWQYEAMAHEGGHAFWWKSLGPEAVESPVLWEPASPWFEGFAHFFERLIFEPSFAERYVPELPAEYRDQLQHWRRANTATWITDAIVQTQAERRLYADPADLRGASDFAADTRSRLTGSPKPPASEDGFTYDPALISSILWNYPAYSQNYLYAYMTEAWLYEGVKEAVGDPVGNPKVGPLLQERMVRVGFDVSFPDRVAALAPGKRTDAIKAYIEVPRAPAPKADVEEVEGDGAEASGTP